MREAALQSGGLAMIKKKLILFHYCDLLFTGAAKINNNMGYFDVIYLMDLNTSFTNVVNYKVYLLFKRSVSMVSKLE